MKGQGVEVNTYKASEMLPSVAITRVSRPNGRFYRVEGFDELFPSVTTVLRVIAKPALIPWARNVALEAVRGALLDRAGRTEWVTSEWVDQVITEARSRPDQARTEAADFGTQAHILIDQVLQGLEPEVPLEFVPVLDNFKVWRQSAGLDMCLAETMVYSARYHYAGAMDALAYRGQYLVALDWKTSNGLYPEYALQVAAYAKALEEMTGHQVKEAWAVRLGKTTPEFEARRVVDLEAAFNAFRAALFLWRWMQKGASFGDSIG
jgi:hypothetical protein